jgi:hypothetical protein
MFKLELNPKEREMLMEILSSYHSDLRFEIAGTDQQDFRESLKEKEAFLDKLLNMLGNT